MFTIILEAEKVCSHRKPQQRNNYQEVASMGLRVSMGYMMFGLATSATDTSSAPALAANQQLVLATGRTRSQD